MTTSYESPGPSREEIDATVGPLVLEFGTSWCGYCQNAASHVSLALSEHAPVPYLKIEDGPGRRLGRSFRVKLWPTLIFLRSPRRPAARLAANPRRASANPRVVGTTAVRIPGVTQSEPVSLATRNTFRNPLR
jgi:thioredoxin 1